MIEWIDCNKCEAKAMAGQLVACLNSCFPKKWKSPRGARDKVWKNYFELRISDKYGNFWKKALSDSIKTEASPIFYQYIADRIIEKLIATHFPVGSRAHESEHLTEPLGFEEMSALRYAAGSVIRSLRERVKRSAHPLKGELLLHLEEVLEASGMMIIRATLAKPYTG